MWETLKVAIFAIPQRSCRGLPGLNGFGREVAAMTPDCSVIELASDEDRHPKRSPCVSSTAGNQSFELVGTSGVRRCASKTPVGISIQFELWRCEAAHPGTMICSNRLPLMVADALRTGLHAAAPMRRGEPPLKGLRVRTEQSTVSVTRRGEQLHGAVSTWSGIRGQ